MSGYCQTCRTEFGKQDNPPYAVIHTSDGKHLHPETRAICEEDTPT